VKAEVDLGVKSDCSTDLGEKSDCPTDLGEKSDCPTEGPTMGFAVETARSAVSTSVD
jgi:hypothetical protein